MSSGLNMKMLFIWKENLISYDREEMHVEAVLF